MEEKIFRALIEIETEAARVTEHTKQRQQQQKTELDNARKEIEEAEKLEAEETLRDACENMQVEHLQKVTDLQRRTRRALKAMEDAFEDQQTSWEEAIYSRLVGK